MSYIGKQFQVVANKEDYTVLEEHDQGYLTVQPSAYKRAGLQSGCDVIHISEIDGETYKWHSPAEIDLIRQKEADERLAENRAICQESAMRPRIYRQALADDHPQGL